MGRVQGGARAAFATPSWGPARMMCFLHKKRNPSGEPFSLYNTNLEKKVGRNGFKCDIVRKLCIF